MELAPASPLDTAVLNVHRRWGSDALFAASAVRTGRPISLDPARVEQSPIASIPTPLWSCVQGAPLVEITGAPQSGKTSLALGLLAALLPAHGLAAYVDSARTFHPPSAATTQLDLRRVWVIRSPGWQDTLAVTETLLASGVIDIVLWDLVARREDLSGAQLRRLRLAAERHGSTILLLTMQSTRPAGRALDYAAGVRLVVRREACLWKKIGSQRLVQGYRLNVEIARAPGKRFIQPVELTIGRPGSSREVADDMQAVPADRG